MHDTDDARALADELTRVRGRGLNEVDRIKGRPDAARRQDRLDLPRLERLVDRHGFDRGSRPLGIRLLLQHGLDRFAEDFPGDATVVRSLYFGADGEPPPPHGASALLRRARGDSTEAAFRRRQRGLLERFAAFLLTWETSAPPPGSTPPAPPPPATDPQPQPQPRRRPRGVVAGAAAAAAVALVAVVVMLLALDGAGPAGSQPDTGNDVADEAPRASVPVRFNSLGGTTSKVIDLFADPRVDREETTKTATYLHGQTSRAFCVTRGRLVASAVALGEEDRSSDQWLLIDGPPDVDAYASVTYLDIAPDDLAGLPDCEVDAE